MRERELRDIWKKYIDNKYAYRVVPEKFVKDIKKEGLNPKKNPFRKRSPEIKKLFRLVLKLDKKDFVHKQDWGFKEVDGKYIVMVSLEDLTSHYIDFASRYSETHFYKKHTGGALVQTILKITKDILDRKPPLTKKEKELVEELNKWAKKESNTKNKTVFVKLSSPAFENALFQVKLGKKQKGKYLNSPCGSFKHFKRIVEKEGFALYEPYIKGDKNYYLRLRSKLSPEEIVKII